MRKRVNIKEKQSEKDYFTDLQIPKNTPNNPPSSVRKSILISAELEEKIKQYIYKKRMNGDVYYTQTMLFKDALERYIKQYY